MDQEEFLSVAREADAYASLNYSKTKRISAVDVELHLRSMGALAPVTTSLERSTREMGSTAIQANLRTHNTPAP
jgi:hypothetical protein